jgi:hypothetical protein
MGGKSHTFSCSERRFAQADALGSKLFKGNFFPLEYFCMLRTNPIDITGQASHGRPALSKQQEAYGIVFFRNLYVDHPNLKIGALVFDVKVEFALVLLRHGYSGC